MCTVIASGLATSNRTVVPDDTTASERVPAMLDPVSNQLPGLSVSLMTLTLDAPAGRDVVLAHEPKASERHAQQYEADGPERQTSPKPRPVQRTPAVAGEQSKRDERERDDDDLGEQRVVDAVLQHAEQPRSTLLMMVTGVVRPAESAIDPVVEFNRRHEQQTHQHGHHGSARERTRESPSHDRRQQRQRPDQHRVSQDMDQMATHRRLEVQGRRVVEVLPAHGGERNQRRHSNRALG